MGSKMIRGTRGGYTEPITSPRFTKARTKFIHNKMGKHSKKKHNNSFRNNPPRGTPGFLVLCETSREKKCEREALEILRHYFYGGKKSEDSSSAKDSTGKITEQEESQLSLEEEIAMLKKGASADAVLSGTSDPTEKHKAPFRVYDTGCKGTVFIMCTIPDSELISTTISTAKSLHDNGSDGNSQQKRKGGEKVEVSDTTRSCLGKTKQKGDKSLHDNDSDGKSQQKRKGEEKVEVSDTTRSCLGKRTQKDDAASAAPDFEISSSKRQKMDDIDKPKWDPIKTVQSIFRDIREHNTEAPRSRFVSRMVPIQVTCFASMEEIMANATELIKDFLMPKVNALTKGLEDKLPSFKIEFKRRNCNHIRREQIVDGIANIVKDLTAQFWSNHSGEKTGDGSKPLFRVDLDNPDYTIIIELCRTLCGMSVVANTKSYKKFNLIVLQEESTAAHKAN